MAKCGSCKRKISQLSRNQKKSIRTGWKVYCSKRCRYLRAKTGKLTPCANCGQRIWVIKSKQRQRNFCTKRCVAIAVNGSRRGKNHPNYIHGRTVDYRSQAFERYGGRCAYCGYDRHLKLIEVHHIDGNRANWDLSNLIVLCTWHHAAVTRRLAVIKNRRFSWRISADMIGIAFLSKMVTSP